MDDTHAMVNPRLMAVRNGMPVHADRIRNGFQQSCAERIVSKKHSRTDGYTEQQFLRGFVGKLIAPVLIQRSRASKIFDLFPAV